jgi:hypothetical protein
MDSAEEDFKRSGFNKKLENQGSEQNAVDMRRWGGQS